MKEHNHRAGRATHYDFLRLIRRFRAGSAPRKTTLMVLAEYAGLDDAGQWAAFPPLAMLAVETEQNERTVRRHLHELAERGVLRIEARNTPTGRTSNRYVFDLDALESPPDNLGAGPSPVDSPADSPGSEPSGHLMSARKSQEEPTKEPTARARPAQDALPIADEAAQQFELFWQAYPTRDGKKIGKGKSFEFWRRMTLVERRAAWRGAVNLARGVAEGGRFGVQDPERFLRTERYRDWQDPATVEPDPANRVQNAFDVIDRVAAQRKETHGNGRRTGALEVPSRQLPPGPR